MDNSKRTLLIFAQLLSKYEWLLNSYNMDFYINDHWNKIPSKWAECLNKLDLFDIPWVLHSSIKTPKCVLPLTFLCLRFISYLVRSRRSKKCDHIFNFFSDRIKSTGRHCFSQNLNTVLDHILVRGIKKKKRHEIEQLCKLISSLMEKFDNNLDIIDFGSGKGHLSRILTLCYGYRVFCIEANNDIINGALVTENKVLNALKKYNKNIKNIKNINKFDVSIEMPIKVNCFLTDKNEIDQLFDDKITRPHLLLGLHACGSLSNLILEKFVKNPNSHCLILVCCCYMKSELFRFPMSNVLKENSSFILSIEAKELACHAIEKFLNKFSQKELECLKIHPYRACLELLIEKYTPDRRHQPMKSVKIFPGMTFKEYVAKATKGFDDIIIPEDVFQSDLVEGFISQIDRVVMFYSLRLLIAPIVELFILLDYEQFLREQDNIQATYLFPLFEPSISPRNFILLAHK